MEIVAITFRQIVKMAVMLLIGICCFKVGLLDDEKSKTLSGLLTKIVTPALIIASFQREYDSALLNNLLFSVILAAASMVLSYICSNLIVRKKEGFDNVVEKFGAAYSNCGFIGYPLAYGIFGSEGMFYMVGFNLVFNLCVFAFGEASMRGSFGKGFIKQVVLNPVTLASIIGVAFFLLRIELPDLIYDPLDMMGSMNTPLAMLVAGCSIAQMDIKGVLKKKRVYLASAVKLLVTPLLFIAIFRFIPVPHLVYMTTVLATACPTATLTIIFSLLYNHDDLYASEIFTSTVLFSTVTIPLVFAVAVL